MEEPIRILTSDRDEARRRPAIAGTDEGLPEELDKMTWDTRQSGEEARNWRTQLVNALMLAAWDAPAAPQAPEAQGQ
jgi:hypothetical protein